MIDIIELTNSNRENKRFKITLDIDGKQKSWHFGAKHGSTYLDHHDPVKRANYLKRHLANPTERERILNNIPSNALFSAKLLWGDSTDLLDNLIQLNALLRKK